MATGYFSGPIDATRAYEMKTEARNRLIHGDDLEFIEPQISVNCLIQFVSKVVGRNYVSLSVLIYPEIEVNNVRRAQRFIISGGVVGRQIRTATDAYKPGTILPVSSNSISSVEYLETFPFNGGIFCQHYF